MRTIDADALKIHVCNMCDDGQRECKGDESCAILCWINDMPTIEAEPVKRGEWITHDYFDGDVYYVCSVCGKEWYLNDGTPKDNGMKFCPNCGAKMYQSGGIITKE